MRECCKHGLGKDMTGEKSDSEREPSEVFRRKGRHSPLLEPVQSAGGVDPGHARAREARVAFRIEWLPYPATRTRKLTLEKFKLGYIWGPEGYL